MKSVGIARKMDELGGIVIPKELWRTMDMLWGMGLKSMLKAIGSS